MGDQEKPERISRRTALTAAGTLAALFLPATAWPQDTSQSIELSPVQRQLIYASLSRQTHRSTAAPPTFNPAVGATVPEGVEFGSLPETVVEMAPQVRGLLFAFVGGQVLLVEPKTRRIVAAITQSAA